MLTDQFWVFSPSSPILISLVLFGLAHTGFGLARPPQATVHGGQYSKDLHHHKQLQWLLFKSSTAKYTHWLWKLVGKGRRSLSGVTYALAVATFLVRTVCCIDHICIIYHFTCHQRDQPSGFAQFRYILFKFVLKGECTSTRLHYRIIFH